MKSQLRSFFAVADAPPLPPAQVADKQKPGVWVCKDPWVRKYGLAEELPGSLQPASGAASECKPPVAACVRAQAGMQDRERPPRLRVCGGQQAASGRPAAASGQPVCGCCFRTQCIRPHRVSLVGAAPDGGQRCCACRSLARDLPGQHGQGGHPHEVAQQEQAGSRQRRPGAHTGGACSVGHVSVWQLCRQLVRNTAQQFARRL